jgi:hypothetical protein
MELFRTWVRLPTTPPTQQAGKTEVELDLARAIVREQDYEAAKAAYLTLKWVLQELETLDY